jgi:hypothetical protein
VCAAKAEPSSFALPLNPFTQTRVADAGWPFRLEKR